MPPSAADDTGLRPIRPRAGQEVDAVARAGPPAVAALFGLMARGLLTIAKVGMASPRYPRHSLAAAASLVILGAIWYTQSPGSPRR